MERRGRSVLDYAANRSKEEMEAIAEKRRAEEKAKQEQMARVCFVFPSRE
jgi:hypothetical protein